MKSLIIVLAFIGSSAIASTNGYEININLSMNGKPISSPRIIVKAGETTTITQKTDNELSFIEITASEGSVQNNKGILMNFVVGVIGKNGKRTIKAKPQVLAKENQQATITVGENKGNEISLSVIANRKSL